jgi:acyl-CoA hydrolase
LSIQRNYIPLNLREVPDYRRRFLDPVDIVILKACPMDDGGYFNFGPANRVLAFVISSYRYTGNEQTPT